MHTLPLGSGSTLQLQDQQHLHQLPVGSMSGNTITVRLIQLAKSNFKKGFEIIIAFRIALKSDVNNVVHFLKC